jgi:antitoxin (DNA-binding transcriptional repressor) of toxin-antitoxin stability system
MKRSDIYLVSLDQNRHAIRVTVNRSDLQFPSPSNLLLEVATGEVITVLLRGKAVATIAPPRADGGQREAAKRNLLVRLRQQKPSGTRSWTRHELYEG